jgi:hypothetical protein
MSCTLKRRWLDALTSDLDELKKWEKRTVNDYGPVDLNNPAGRVLFVKMLCRLLIGLTRNSKFARCVEGEDGKEKSDDKKAPNDKKEPAVKKEPDDKKSDGKKRGDDGREEHDDRTKKRSLFGRT